MTCFSKSICRFVVLLMLFFAAAQGGYATTLTADRDLSSGVALQASPDSVTAQPDGLTYSWADRDGDGSSNAVNAGLDLADYDLTRSVDNTGYTLNLNDGTSDAAISWGGSAGGLISTKRIGSGDKHGGPLTVTGVTDIVCANIDTSGNGTGKGGRIIITQSGNLTVSNILARPRITPWAGIISLFGAGRATGTPAGWLQVHSSIATYGNNAAAIEICGYDKVTVGSGGLLTYQDYAPASSDFISVTMTNIGSGGVSVTGPVDTYSTGNDGLGNVIIGTAGDVTLSSVDTHRGKGGNWVYCNAGRIEISAGGNVSVSGALETYMLGPGSGSYSRDAGDIMITSTNGSVTLNSLNTTNKTYTGAGRNAGDVMISSFGDLTITGSISLDAGYGGTRRGALNLVSTGAGSKITVQDLDCSLFKVSGSTFHAAGGKSYINGVVANFDVGVGSRLEAAAGQVIFYEGRLSGNEYLNSTSHTLAGGGILRPYPQGTIIRFR